MKPSGNIYRPLILIGLCVTTLLLAGCIKDNLPIEYPETATLQLNVGTKAVAETTGELSDVEVEAAIHTFRLFAFVGEEQIGHYFDDGSPSVKTNFLMDVQVYQSYQNNGSIPIQFYAIANEAAMAGVDLPWTGEGRHYSLVRRNDIETISYTGLNDIKKFGLPMFVHKMENINMMEDRTQKDENGNDVKVDPGTIDSNHSGHTLISQSVTLNLVRTVAKLSVFMAKAENEGTLKPGNITFKKEGRRMLGYLYPGKDLTGIAAKAEDRILPVDNVEVGPIATTIDPNNKPEAYTSIQTTAYYPFETAEGSTLWSENQNARGAVLNVPYSFDNGSTFASGTVYLPKMERNHYYAVCCLVHNVGGMEVKYYVADWDDVDDDGNSTKWDDLVFGYPTYSPFRPLDGVSYPAAPICYYNPLSDSTEGTFAAQFTLSAPAGQEWDVVVFDSPYLWDAKVYQKVGDKEVEATKLVASDIPYIIRLRPKQDVVQNKIVRIGISYSPSWDPDNSSLLNINPDANADKNNVLYWNGDNGTLHDRFTITQIPAPTN